MQSIYFCLIFCLGLKVQSAEQEGNATQANLNVVVGGIGEKSVSIAEHFGELANPGAVYRIRFHVHLPGNGLMERVEAAAESISGPQRCVRTLDVSSGNDPRIASFLKEAASKPCVTLAIEVDYTTGSKFFGTDTVMIGGQLELAAQIATRAKEAHTSKFEHSTDMLFVHGEATGVMQLIDAPASHPLFAKEIAASPNTFDLPENVIVFLTEHGLRMGNCGWILTQEERLLGKESPSSDMAEWVARGNPTFMRSIETTENPVGWMGMEAYQVVGKLGSKAATSIFDAQDDPSVLAKTAASVAGKQLGTLPGEMSVGSALGDWVKDIAKESTIKAAEVVGYGTVAASGLGAAMTYLEARNQVRAAEAESARAETRAVRVTMSPLPVPEIPWKPGDPPPSPQLRHLEPVVLTCASLAKAEHFWSRRVVQSRAAARGPTTVGSRPTQVEAPPPPMQDFTTALQKAALPHKGGGIALVAAAEVPLQTNQIGHITWDPVRSCLVVRYKDGRTWYFPPISPEIMRCTRECAADAVDIEFSIGAVIAEPGSFPFLLKDIKDSRALVVRLAQGADPMATFVRDALDPKTRASILACGPSNTPSHEILVPLVANLNNIISGSSIYEKKRFARSYLRPETEALIMQQRETRRANRLLLEDAFPMELSQNDDAPPGTLDITQLGMDAAYYKPKRAEASFLGLAMYRADAVLGKLAFTGSSALDALGFGGLIGLHTLPELCPSRYVEQPGSDKWGDGGSRIVVESRPAKLLDIGNGILAWNEMVVELVPRFARTTPAEQAFTSGWIENYPAIIARSSELNDLLECARAVGLMKWALASRAILDLTSLDGRSSLLFTYVNAPQLSVPSFEAWKPTTPLVVFGPNGPTEIFPATGGVTRVVYADGGLERIERTDGAQFVVHRDDLGSPFAVESSVDGTVAFVTAPNGRTFVVGPVALEKNGCAIIQQNTRARFVTDPSDFVETASHAFLSGL